MKLTIQAKELHNKSFKITNNIGEHYELSDISDKVEYDFPIAGEYTFFFEQIQTPKLPKAISVILYLLTAVMQGIFHILLFNTDSDWCKNIDPYLIKGSFTTYLFQDTIINLSYVPAHYEEITHIWTPSAIRLSQNCDLTAEHIKNDLAFSEQYETYAKKLISVSLIGFILFGTLLGVAITQNILWGVILSAALILFIVILIGGLLISAYREMCHMRDEFQNHQTM